MIHTKNKISLLDVDEHVISRKSKLTTKDLAMDFTAYCFASHVHLTQTVNYSIMLIFSLSPTMPFETCDILKIIPTD